MALPTFTRGRKRNSRYKISDRSLRPSSLVFASILFLVLGGLGWVWSVMLTKGYVAIGGVPSPVIASFLQNETARDAYFDGNTEQLHAQIQKMNLAEKLKPYYRPQFEDEAKLDLYTHQILYDRTGYIGKDYQANPQGTLSLKKSIKTESSVGLKVRR
ncbi:hypothetical protein [Synechocystis sp. PCC 7509]|uniref:hypothetical protein n=1 Tax=Synechocystis sp. PCC 7509 TaxID=927677 RepID=UPI0002AC8D62|nr:hypothetical protein [Synechocystis sp. PCC 7509]